MTEERWSFSLFDQIRESGYSASIIATYNAYFPFYEQVVLRRLMAAGCSHNIVMMDARQCAIALASDDLRPRLAGSAYTLIPVPMKAAFHPKVLVHLGKKKGALVVGSHNLTVAGFGLNNELTNTFHYDGSKASQPIAFHFQVAIDLLASRLPVGLTEIQDAFDAALQFSPWLSKHATADDGTTILGSRPGSPPLWEQLKPLVPRPVRRALVLSPFFDKNLGFLDTLTEDLKPDETVVAVDPETVELNVGSASRFSKGSIVDIKSLIPSEKHRENVKSYLHAKALWFDTREGEVLVTGSANASARAFLSPGKDGNAEVVVVRRTGGDHSLAKHIGLLDFLGAPEVTKDTLKQIRDRIREARRSKDGRHASTLLATTSEDGFRVNARLPQDAEVSVKDSEGSAIGNAIVVSEGPPAQLRAGSDVREHAHLLEIEKDGTVRMAVVHHPYRIAEHYRSDTGRALRQALGKLDEEPAQLELLLKLSEKVIFDAEEVASRPWRAAGGQVTASGTDEPVAGPESLSIDAPDRSGPGRWPSIGRGDITVILDVLIRSLGKGLSSESFPIGPSEEEQIGADDDTDKLPPPVVPDAHRLARLCRRKVKRLLKRMREQMELACEEGFAHRAIVQLATVLCILAALRAVEQRDEWKREGERLMNEEVLRLFFKKACSFFGAVDGGLAEAALKEAEGMRFEEISIAAGLLVWLAWECEVDAIRANEDEESPEDEEDPWYWVQHLAYLAPSIASDDLARKIAIDNVTRSPRRHADHEAWLAAHLAFLEQFARVLENLEQCKAIPRPPKPGDIVVLPEKYDPRVRLVTDVVSRPLGLYIQVVDECDEKGQKKFIAERVKLVALPIFNASR